MARAAPGRFVNALPATPDAPSWLAERDPALRVVAAFAFALVVVSLSSLALLFAAFAGAGLLALAAGVPPRSLARRLLALEGFVLVLVVFLPFTVPGPPVFEVLGLTASQAGLSRAGGIVLTAGSVVVAVQGLLGSVEAVALGYALGRLRLPAKLVHLFLFTVRYVEVLQREYQTLRRAMRARAFSPGTNRHTWRSLGWLFGMLLVRGLERARRIQAAMRCRGYTGQLPLLQHQSWRAADTVFALTTGAILSSLLLVEHYP